MVKASETFASAFVQGATKSSVTGVFRALNGIDVRDNTVGPIAGVARFRVAERDNDAALSGFTKRHYFVPRSRSTRRRFTKTTTI